MHLEQLIKHGLETHGYWVLFIGTFLEGETILLMAGFLAFQGYFDITAVVLTSWLGSFCGDQVYFYLGRRHGGYLLKRFHFIARRLREALRLIERYGKMVAFISRFTYGFRIVLPVILGITKLPPRTFFLINITSALVWASIFSIAGYLFGKSASIFLNNMKEYEHYLLLLLAIIMFTIWSVHAYHIWNLKKPARERLLRLRAYRATYLKENDVD